MNQEILDFIKSQRISVLAVEMGDGTPHAASLGFSHLESPLLFFFETLRNSRKGEVISTNKTTKASMVIGFSENPMKTLQLDGSVSTVDEKEKIQSYLEKFPQKKDKLANKNEIVFFQFTPNWWRYTDWTKPEGKLVLSSE